jgi:hypothetical protein
MLVEGEEWKERRREGRRRRKCGKRWKGWRRKRWIGRGSGMLFGGSSLLFRRVERNCKRRREVEKDEELLPLLPHPRCSSTDLYTLSHHSARPDNPPPTCLTSIRRLPPSPHLGNALPFSPPRDPLFEELRSPNTVTSHLGTPPQSRNPRPRPQPQGYHPSERSQGRYRSYARALRCGGSVR